jgi:peptidoglycan/xylan/chitin deacetylase (PgdA/CDA1 family)
VPAADIALTVDDGTDADVIEAYARLSARTGLRLTFFPNGINPGWTTHAPLLRPLVEAGQVQIGNHTWSHPDLTRIAPSRAAEEIGRNEDFVQRTYGVTARPYLRPPYGAHDSATDHLAADLGYTHVTLWNGTLGDSALLTPAVLMAQARQWLGSRRIVLGHANHPTVVGLYDQLLGLLQDRHLRTVTLDEAFGTSRAEG